MLNLVGVSDALSRIRRIIHAIAPLDTTVLITGETGTGKEIVANLLHKHSNRSSFVTLNCAAFQADLFESELFGHIKGAFTGAFRSKVGIAETVKNGTLFLDEVGECPIQLQPKLLRLIEYRDFRPVGSTVTKHCSARFIFASNADLLAKKLFRRVKSLCTECM